MEAIVRPKAAELRAEAVIRRLRRWIVAIAKWGWRRVMFVARLVVLIGKYFLRGVFMALRRVAVGLGALGRVIGALFEAPPMARQVGPGLPPEEVRRHERLFEQGPIVR